MTLKAFSPKREMTTPPTASPTPSSSPTPRRISPPICERATSPSRTGVPPSSPDAAPATVAPRSSRPSQVAAAADHVLVLGQLDDRAADVVVGALDRHRSTSRERQAVRLQPLRVEDDLVLLTKPPIGATSDTPSTRGQRVAQVPVLQAAQLRQVLVRPTAAACRSSGQSPGFSKARTRSQALAPLLGRVLGARVPACPRSRRARALADDRASSSPGYRTYW